MDRFRWLEADGIPAAFDLRRCGWTLVGQTCHFDAVTLQRFAGGGPDQAALPRRKTTLLIGVAESSMRAALLRAGYGDVVGLEPGLEELAARAARVNALAGYEPPKRRHGALEVDLLARDAFVAGRAVGLHPREFALLWRLMAEGGASVDKVRLLEDVWKLRHVPETNSLPVHVSRLRRKLAQAGYPALIATRPDGYAYVPVREAGPALPLGPDRDGLDAYLRMADEMVHASSRGEP